uniref:Maturase K n=1 Tax=Opuntia elizondoana TaxID=867485 RepID=H1ZTS0_9CARY|nr:maturase K [Opuntia elizondoana]
MNGKKSMSYQSRIRRIFHVPNRYQTFFELNEMNSEVWSIE